MHGGYLEVVFVGVLVHGIVTQAEVFSSVDRMLSLISLEMKVIDHLEKIIDVSRKHGEGGSLLKELQRHLARMKDRHLAISQEPWRIQDPVVGFSYLRRLVGAWNRVQRAVSKYANSNTSHGLVDNLLSMINVLSKWQHWPRNSDVTGSSLGLITIGHVYDLFPSPSWLSNDSSIAVCADKSINSSLKMLAQTSYLSLSFLEKYHLTRQRQSSLPNVSDKDTIVKIINITTNCEYSYWTLPVNDYLFTSRIALQYGMYHEAKRWLALAESGITIQRQESSRLIAQMGSLRNWLTQSQKSPGNFDERTPIDDTQAGYLRLCRESIQASLTTPGHPDRSLYCYWSSPRQYLRHKAEIIHLSPLLVRYYDVISHKEIDHVRSLALTRLTPSDLHTNNRTRDRRHLLRVSQTAWLPDDTDVVSRLSARVQDVTGLDTSQRSVGTSAEPFQVVNYGLGGLYVPHEDSVRVARLLGNESSATLQGSGDRIATWMFYLSDVEAGGATVFPLLNTYVRPVKGSAIFWYNLKRNGDPDRNLVHASCPVLLGNKRVANKWIRESGQTFRRLCSTNPDE